VLCRIYRWKLSGAIDSGKPLSGTVKRHLLRCASCREFAGFAEDTGRRLTRDAGVLVGSVDQSLADSVKSSLGHWVESPTFRPGANLRLPDALTQKSGNWGIDNLVPILAAAATLVVVGASVLWVVRSRPQPMPELTPPFQIETPGAYLEAAVEKVGSPYEKEIRRWKEAFDSTAKTLEACFDIGLGEGKK
jgi:hypothetical protein